MTTATSGDDEPFLEELSRLVASLEGDILALETSAGVGRADRDLLESVFRAAHNIKSAAGMLGLAEAARTAHEMESVLEEARESGRITRENITRLLHDVDTLRAVLLFAQRPATIEPAEPAEPAEPLSPPALLVGVRRVDALVDLAAEMAIAVSRVEQLRAEGVPADDGRADAAGREIKRLAGRLQEAAMAMRLVPLEASLARLRRFVRDQAIRLGKEVIVEVRGGQTELDKSVGERLLDPLKHLVRNALDHGLEPPAERELAGKPRAGRLVLSALQEQGEVSLVVEDDGRGLDLDRIRAAAQRRGLLDPAEDLAEPALLDLVFLPGFSTAEAVGELSGRGVGLDVVRRNLQELGGSIRVESEPGRGTRFSLSVPLTLAVIEGLLVLCGGERVVLPIDRVRALVRPGPGQIARLPDGSEILRLSEQPVPLLRAASLFGEAGAPAAQDAVVVVVETAAGALGLLTDEVLSQETVMLKPLQRSLRVDTEGVLGAAVLGDGGVALILDVARLSTWGRRERSPRPRAPNPEVRI